MDINSHLYNFLNLYKFIKRLFHVMKYITLFYLFLWHDLLGLHKLMLLDHYKKIRLYKLFHLYQIISETKAL